ncbi:MAG: hypothetical protein QG583_446 [Patescibacteria group bacterium]|nr:hypothetical protein [Patescibacteria group bacterium]
MPTKKILKKKHTHYHKDLPRLASGKAGGTIWAKGFMAGELDINKKCHMVSGIYFGGCNFSKQRSFPQHNLHIVLVKNY